jgi:hypothetical protein
MNENNLAKAMPIGPMHGFLEVKSNKKNENN